jgi:hypothetical protein
VHARSTPTDKVAFFAGLFAARSDIYALRSENAQTGRSWWLPAVRGGWRKGVRHTDRHYLPSTPDVITAHLSGEVCLGLYPRGAVQEPGLHPPDERGLPACPTRLERGSPSPRREQGPAQAPSPMVNGA